MVANGLEPVEVMTRIAYDCVFIDCPREGLTGERCLAAGMDDYICRQTLLGGASRPVNGRAFWGPSPGLTGNCGAGPIDPLPVRGEA
jgi:hypothetical protein